MNRNALIGGFIFLVIGIASRIISSVPNFSAVEAIALLGGTYMASRYLGIIVPILSLYIVDLVLNNTVLRGFYPDHSGLVLWDSYMLFNFGAIALIAFMGSFLLKKIDAFRVITGAIIAPIIFFLVTNFGAWLTSSLYSKSFSGLIESYIAGRPFFKASFLGTLVFTCIIFGSFEMIKRYSLTRKLATEKI